MKPTSNIGINTRWFINEQDSEGVCGMTLEIIFSMILLTSFPLLVIGISKLCERHYYPDYKITRRLSD